MEKQDNDSSCNHILSIRRTRMGMAHGTNGGFMKYLLLAVAVSLVGCGQNDPGLSKKVDLSKAQLAEIENRITPFSVVNVEGGNPEVSTMPILPGELKYAACGACHGANGGGGVGPGS